MYGWNVLYELCTYSQEGSTISKENPVLPPSLSFTPSPFSHYLLANSPSILSHSLTPTSSSFPLSFSYPILSLTSSYLSPLFLHPLLYFPYTSLLLHYPFLSLPPSYITLFVMGKKVNLVNKGLISVFLYFSVKQNKEK
jgi:hypothetical protein